MKDLGNEVRKFWCGNHKGYRVCRDEEKLVLINPEANGGHLCSRCREWFCNYESRFDNLCERCDLEVHLQVYDLTVRSHGYPFTQAQYEETRRELLHHK